MKIPISHLTRIFAHLQFASANSCILSSISTCWLIQLCCVQLCCNHKCHQNLLYLKGEGHLMWTKNGQSHCWGTTCYLLWYEMSLELLLQCYNKASCVDQCCTGMGVNACYQYTKSILDQYWNWIKSWEYLNTRDSVWVNTILLLAY